MLPRLSSLTLPVPPLPSLAVQGATAPLQEYRITVFTSDVRGAGTDANVFIELHGALGSVGQNRLETHGVRAFRRGVELRGVVATGNDLGCGMFFPQFSSI